MNYFELKNNFIKLFEQENIEEKSDIDWIMVEITGKKRSMLKFHEFSSKELDEINFAINKRLKHIPFGYIFNKAYFFGREFYVSNKTLIPRQDTEILIETILPFIKEKTGDAEILDIGTGSGIIAITIERETKQNVTAVDISEDALSVAKKNAENLGSNVKFIKSDLFNSLNGNKFDFIVSNPPYIKSDVIQELEPEVRLNEPILALDGGEDGLIFYKKIIFEAKNYLNEKGMLFFEIGYDQAESVKTLMNENFENIKIIKDYSENDRVVFGTLRG